MTPKQIAVAIAFAIFWTGFMVWWSNDYSVAQVVIMTIMGLIVGFAWVWVMKRLGYFRF